MPELNIYMHCEKQMRLMGSIQYQHVALHVDSTGKLAKWPNKPVKYKKWMNYAIVLKDLRNLSKPGIIVMVICEERAV